MGDGARVGKPWADDELDAIIADYFSMLAEELAGRAYVKAHHSAALMQKIGRTHRSVEFKHQNISAVLDELGMPWIEGYIPKRNYQAAIFPAIDRYLTAHPEVFDFIAPAATAASVDETFVEAPVLGQQPEEPEGLRALVRKFDPIERDRRNRSLGRAGEEFVLDLERRRLTDGGFGDLASRVRWISEEEGDGAGYDVLSFDLVTGSERQIEVKTTNGSARTPFFVTRNEFAMSKRFAGEWRLYRVHHFAQGPRVFTLTPPLDSAVHLTPEVWRAEFGR
ncbi:MAG: DUF3883 domain-containing protein [Bryobacteraceae bacterium]